MHVVDSIMIGDDDGGSSCSLGDSGLGALLGPLYLVPVPVLTLQMAKLMFRQVK